MKKLIVIAALMLAGSFLTAQVHYVRVDDHQTKYELLTQQMGVRCRISDFAVSTLFAQPFRNMETAVRTVDVDGDVAYFFRVYRKETKELSAAEAFVAYEDFVEIDRELESMMEEERKDRSARKDYCENFYRTDDGFQVGYYIQNRQTNWYVVMGRHAGEKIHFDNVARLKEHFEKALAKFDEMKKKEGK